ncbi:MAG: chorismate synthase [Planctomycetaceae bacterium]|jgi:chorismate synthase|nr:chorismate synthase [Planctomycetaceae bacterium]
MARLDYHTAGESHGPALLAFIQGLPAGLPVDFDFINAELRRRQGGYGRGGRQRIETDTAEPLSGIRLGKTTGSPIALRIPNKDSRLDDLERTPPVHTPRPGHADLAGSVKYLTTDCRETLERASARETAARVAAGALARCLLRALGIECFGFVRSVHQAATSVQVTPDNHAQLLALRDASDTYCPDPAATEAQHAVIRQAKVDKTTVGGIVECHIFNCPPGLGSTMHWADRLDSRIAAAVMGIQAFKGVEMGLGMATAQRFGHEVHDPIAFNPALAHLPSLGFTRESNNAGGTEGGMTNGAPIVVRGAMKPISTLLRGMPSVDLNTKQPAQSAYERSDISAVAAASVVMENVVAFEVARSLREKFGADSLTELLAQYQSYLTLARQLPLA